MLMRRAIILACFIFATGAAFAQMVQSDHRSRADIVTSQQLKALSVVTTCDSACMDWRNSE